MQAEADILRKQLAAAKNKHDEMACAVEEERQAVNGQELALKELRLKTAVVGSLLQQCSNLHEEAVRSSPDRAAQDYHAATTKNVQDPPDHSSAIKEPLSAFFRVQSEEGLADYIDFKIDNIRSILDS